MGTTTSKEAKAIEAPAAPPVQVMDLDGLPVFLPTSNQYDEIEALGHNHYYVLAGSSDKVAGPNNSTVTHESVKLWRVTKSHLGRAITEATANSAGLKFGTGQSFTLELPPIPYELLMKMDAFFRAVYAKHKTEAILMLVYNMDYLHSETPSQGWGAIAPEQKNTGGFCDYEPDTIIETLEDNVVLVGSAHSHPEMSAFASDVDHKDQAGWDGIHITYGWRSSVNRGATEHYSEVQYAGKKWALGLNELVEMAPKPTFAEAELDPWLKNVTKNTAIGTTHHTSHSSPKSGTPTPSYSPGASGGNGFAQNILHRAPIKLPATAPDPKKNVIVGLVKSGDNPSCPFCHSPLDSREIQHGRCFACFNFVVTGQDVIPEINKLREEFGARPIPDLDVAKSEYPILLWDGGDTFTEDLRAAPAKK